MDIITQIVIAVIIGAGVTLITVRIVIAELKRDMLYMKQELEDVKSERRSDINELRLLIKENNAERKATSEKMERHIEQIFTAINKVQVDIAKIQNK